MIKELWELLMAIVDLVGLVTFGWFGISDLIHGKIELGLIYLIAATVLFSRKKASA